MIRIQRHKNTRHWAVWQGEKLLAVVCYKKGALAIKKLLTDLLNKRKSRKSNKIKPT